MPEHPPRAHRIPETRARVADTAIKLVLALFALRELCSEGDYRRLLYSPLEISAVTRMALGWYITASHYYLMEGRRSLLECFEEVAGLCRTAVLQHQLAAPAVSPRLRPDGRVFHRRE